MNYTDKKEIYNRIMEAASQMVIKMLNEDWFDKSGNEVINDNPADEVEVEIKRITGSFVEEQTGTKGTFSMFSMSEHPDNVWFYFEIMNRAAIAGMSDYLLEFIISEEQNKEWKEQRKFRNCVNIDEDVDECYFAAFSDLSDLDKTMKKLKAYMKKHKIIFDYEITSK